MHHRIELSLLPGKFSVCRLSAEAELPAWIFQENLFAVVRTEDELSVVCLQESVPTSVISEAGWRRLKVHGPLDFSLVGVLASIAVPLAEAGVSIFAISTYDTDYFLIKEEQLETAFGALTQAGFKVITNDSLFT